jgi:hypothetical protein
MMSFTAWACLVLSPATLHLVSDTTSTAWSHPVLSLCCTEHDTYHGAILSGRLNSVAMSKSGQMGRHCTVGSHCSGLHVL